MLKRLATICIVLLTATLLLFAASEGPNSAGAGAGAGGGAAWSDPGNIISSNDARASVVLVASDSSKRLEATTFGFSIPNGSSVSGIQGFLERIENPSTAGVCAENEVKLLIGGVAAGDDKSTGIFPSTESSRTIGGVSDLWGTTPTVAQVNATNFGFYVDVVETSTTTTATCEVDHMSMTVTFTFNVGGRRRFITRNAGKILAEKGD